jgi:hypothetical protein
MDHARLRQALLQRCGEAPRMHRQRRAFGHPDLGVFPRHPRTAQRQDQEMQQRAPQPARELHDAMVMQELREIAAHRGRRRRRGRAEVDEQDTHLGNSGLGSSGRVGHRHRMAGPRRLGHLIDRGAPNRGARHGAGKLRVDSSPRD